MEPCNAEFLNKLAFTYNSESSISLFFIKLLSCPQINHVQKSFGIYHRIFRLQISIDDITGVQLLNAENEGGHIEAADFRIAQPYLSEHVEEINAIHILHQQI